MNSVTQSPAMMRSVSAAFFSSGGLKAGTPFDTASTPVMAVQPLAKARRIRNVLRAVTPLGVGLPPGTTGTIAPVTARHAPAPSSASRLARKKYVGMEKMRPDSRMPRRLPIAMRTMQARPISVRLTCHCGKADTTAATPAAMLTATVMT